MHTIWKGSISFGLVHIPIRMFSATQDKSISFRSLHEKCKTPIKYSRYCPTCDTEVPWEEVVKGYEYADNQFVLMKKEELEAILPENRKAIEILDFVKLEEIDPIYYDKSYYLGPGEHGNHAYSLLRDAMAETGKIGVAKITIRSKQSLAVVRVHQSCLVMETIFYPDEVRDVAQVPEVPAKVELPEKEMAMAKQLIDQLTTAFHPEKYQDEYRQAVEEAIGKKVKGEEVVEAPERQPERVVDLMEALKASLEQSGGKKKKPTRKKKTAAR
ncbi:Ku protein [Kroppenstedtia eburnea]|uniref:Non-homologous end joining protein Ku n=1 Tax=Kroppenstedtia eburnea TaxID=714067 RepID=A0A1N7IQP3_9BACL|nr:Ku protein [Kroppenstedtia eburnea]EGK13874.1 Ku family DNA end-binding protein [Desmospora sp. 8437]QKI82094.1 Ku protein [Kroppenstedtia eburnea]SIS39393.1 DNA end-binding protein Ku [Kroppenstedtia eburnea]